MKRFAVNLSFALALGLGMTLALMWLLSGKAASTVRALESVGPPSRVSRDLGGPNSPLPGLTSEAGRRRIFHPSEVGLGERDKVRHALGNLPLRFIANAGQAGPAVRFTVKGAGQAIFFTDQEIVFSASIPQPRITPHTTPSSPRDASRVRHDSTRNSERGTRHSVVRLRFARADPNPTIEGLNPLPGGANFFLGNDPTKWGVNVPTYGGVAYRELYPGIDLVYRGTEGRLKSEFRLAPGAHPSVIQMVYTGLEGLRLREDGALVLETGLGELIEEAPLIYQQVEGERQVVPGGYVLIFPSPKRSVLPATLQGGCAQGWSEGDGYRVGFQVRDYDKAYSLVIDPALVYASYLGGGGIDSGYGIAVSSAGDAYVTGWTMSVDFPIRNAIQATYPNTNTADVFVTQIISTSGVYTYGYSTYLGGTGSDRGYSIALDSMGSAYVTGETFSGDFPAHNAIQPTHANTQTADAFVAQILQAGGVYTLAYSTYLGGHRPDSGYGIAVDDVGRAYVTGLTLSSDFPILNAIQATHANTETTDAFVTQIVDVGGVYTYGYSTYLGGGDVDGGRGIAVPSGSRGDAYITGFTNSSDFPTHNAIQASQGGGDAFVARIINVSGVYTYGYSTYLGGRDYDYGTGIALGSTGDAYVAGWTMSYDFPIYNATQEGLGGLSDAFVTKIISGGGGYTYGYSTYLGGRKDDYAKAIAVDHADNIYVVGDTYSSDFPTRQTIRSYQGNNDVFVAKIISGDGGYAQGYSTFLGGSGYDYGQDIAVFVSGTGGDSKAYVTGFTNSEDFPTHYAMDTALGGGWDVFVAQMIEGRFTYLPVVLRQSP